MKKRQLLDRFVNGYRKIEEWGDEHREEMAIAITAGLLAVSTAFAVKTCQTGVVEPLFGHEAPASEQTVNTTDATAER